MAQAEQQGPRHRLRPFPGSQHGWSLKVAWRSMASEGGPGASWVLAPLSCFCPWTAPLESPGPGACFEWAHRVPDPVCQVLRPTHLQHLQGELPGSFLATC